MDITQQPTNQLKIRFQHFLVHTHNERVKKKSKGLDEIQGTK